MAGNDRTSPVSSLQANGASIAPVQRPAIIDPEATPRLPDIAADTVAPVSGVLQRVGMSGVEVALRLEQADGPSPLIPARASAQVSLDDPNAKGIHMSRLFLTLQQTLEEATLTPHLVCQLLHEFVESQAGLSRSGYLEFEFEYLTKRKSLLTANRSWRSYPAKIQSSWHADRLQHQLSVQVAYSSTCPCSAALVRQLLQHQFQEDFGDQSEVDIAMVQRWLGRNGTLATPHSQRSHADVTVTLSHGWQRFPLLPLIERIESSLATPVQSVVKRKDEQEFARLNGSNLMFCEDAARRIRAALEDDTEFTDYRIQTSHLESLHPHDAVAIVTKGLPHGLRP